METTKKKEETGNLQSLKKGSSTLRKEIKKIDSLHDSLHREAEALSLLRKKRKKEQETINKLIKEYKEKASMRLEIQHHINLLLEDDDYVIPEKELSTPAIPQYPDVYIPYSFRNVKPQTPSPPIEPSKPVAPIKPTWLNPIIVGLITLVIGLFVFMDIPAVALVLGIGTTICSRLIWNKGYRNELKLFRQAQEKYSALITQYQEEKIKFERLIEELNRPEVIREYRLKLIQNLRIYQPDSYNSSAKKGRSESILFDCLKQHLTGEFYDRTALNIPNYDYPYSPDIAYKIDGIYLDIEVDEPYYEKEGVFYPYHGYDEKKEQNRNEFFVERNWIVIRFAEEQVVKYPESCVKEVAKLVNHLLGIPIPKSLVNIPDLKPIPRWTTNQAEMMIQKKYRDQY